MEIVETCLNCYDWALVSEPGFLHVKLISPASSSFLCYTLRELPKTKFSKYVSRTVEKNVENCPEFLYENRDVPKSSRIYFLRTVQNGVGPSSEIGWRSLSEIAWHASKTGVYKPNMAQNRVYRGKIRQNN